MSAEYNGWKNRQTWNVSLTINNDENLYRSAVEFMKTYKGNCAYTRFIIHQGLQDERTPDRIAYFGSKLSYRELNSMMKRLVE